jgi:hypothetical protein
MNARDIAQYILQFTPIAHGGTPAKSCSCGDRVFYRLAVDGPWLCRTRQPSGNDGWRTVACWHYPQCDPPQHIRSAIARWFVVP